MEKLFRLAQSFLFGVTLPMRAAALIARKPALLLWSIIPILITAAIYSFLIVRLQELVQAWVEARFTGWEAWALLLLARVGLVLAGVFTFSITASIAASPFNDILAEKTEKYATPPLPSIPSSGLRRQIRLVMIDVVKSLFAAVAGLTALILSWVPVVNLIAFTLTFLLMAFQFLSYPQTRRGQGIVEGMRFLNRHFFACLGFGAMMTVLFAIPFLSLFFLPVAVVSGTLLYARAQADLK